MPHTTSPFRLTDEQVARFDAEGYHRRRARVLGRGSAAGHRRDLPGDRQAHPAAPGVRGDLARLCRVRLRASPREYKRRDGQDSALDMEWGTRRAGDLRHHPPPEPAGHRGAAMRPRADRQQRVSPASEGAASRERSRSVAPGLRLLRALLRQVAGTDRLDAARRRDAGERLHVGFSPGVHKGEVFRHRGRPGKGYLEIVPDAMPDTERICVPMRKWQHPPANEPHPARKLRERNRYGALEHGSPLPKRGAPPPTPPSRAFRTRRSPIPRTACRSRATRRKPTSWSVAACDPMR